MYINENQVLLKPRYFLALEFQVVEALPSRGVLAFHAMEN